MADFSILDLPLIPQLAVLDNLDNKDLFALSLISKRSKHLVQLANRSIEHVKVELKWESQLRILENDLLLMRLQETTGQPTFEGVDKMAICWSSKAALLHYNEGMYHEVKNRAIRHLFAVFKEFEHVSVSLQNVYPHERVYPHVLWDYTKNLHSLKVTIRDRKLTTEELTFLFEELTISDTFSLSVPEGFEYPDCCKYNRVVLRTPQCLGIDSVITSRSSEIFMFCPLPPATELNRLLKVWIAGGNMENLKTLFIGDDEEVPPRFKDEVLDGITVLVTSGFSYIFQRVDGTHACVTLKYKNFNFNIEQ